MHPTTSKKNDIGASSSDILGGASSSISSSPQRRHNAGLSPRQRRLLNARNRVHNNKNNSSSSSNIIVTEEDNNKSNIGGSSHFDSSRRVAEEIKRPASLDADADAESTTTISSSLQLHSIIQQEFNSLSLDDDNKDDGDDDNKFDITINSNSIDNNKDPFSLATSASTTATTTTTTPNELKLELSPIKHQDSLQSQQSSTYLKRPGPSPSSSSNSKTSLHGFNNNNIDATVTTQKETSRSSSSTINVTNTHSAHYNRIRHGGRYYEKGDSNKISRPAATTATVTATTTATEANVRETAAIEKVVVEGGKKKLLSSESNKATTTTATSPEMVGNTTETEQQTASSIDIDIDIDIGHHDMQRLQLQQPQQQQQSHVVSQTTKTSSSSSSSPTPSSYSPPMKEGEVTTTHATSSSSKSGNLEENRLRIDSKWSATVNTYDTRIPPPHSPSRSPGKQQHQQHQQQDADDEDEDEDELRRKSKWHSAVHTYDHRIPPTTPNTSSPRRKKLPVRDKVDEEQPLQQQRINGQLKVPNQRRQRILMSRYPTDENIGHDYDDDGHDDGHDDNSDDDDDNNYELRYYRIVFRGVVSLLSNLDEVQARQQSPEVQQQQQSDTEPVVITNTAADGGINNGSNSNNINNQVTKKFHVGYGELVGTSYPEIIISLNNNNNNNDTVGSSSSSSEQQQQQQIVVRAIRVDSILTGGYNNANNDNDDAATQLVDDKSEGGQYYGYLLLSTTSSSSSQQESIIAQPIPAYMYNSLQHVSSTTATTAAATAPACERGQFTYRVCSKSLVSILSGPAIDASPLGVGLLPNTTHEVSLRITLPLPPPPSSDDDDDRLGSAGINDILIDEADPAGEIQFLRLSTRRGWVADRRVDAVDEHKVRVSYLMQDVTDEQNEKKNVSFLSSMSHDHDDSTSSVNSTATNASFYASVVASSVATPKSIKSRRRRNRRGMEKKSRVQPLSSATLPSSVLREHRPHAGGESFEEVGSSITGVSNEGNSSSDQQQHQQQSSSSSTKSFYLLRVIAPRGLKILDAPHTQVSNLIHSPVNPHNNAINDNNNSPRQRSPTSPTTISPFARTNAMIISGSSEKQSPVQSSLGRKRNNTRVRSLARGQLFEAEGRMEADTSPYTNGQGLIKLADGSGWAIVPHQQDLVMQLKKHHGNNNNNTMDNINDAVAAFEEIGSATVIIQRQPQLTPPSKQQQQQANNAPTLKDIIWLRIAAPPNGIKVLLPPPQEEEQQQQQTNISPPPSKKQSPSHDSEVASSVSNSFFDSVWSRVTPTKERERQHPNDMGRKTLRQQQLNQQQQQQQQQQQPVIPVIPCGMVVPVYSSDTASNSNQKIFSRLFNGQGWIPRTLGETLYAYEVDAPDIRIGSVWFRVKSHTGLNVRHGPSNHAPVIKSSNDASFRFECGEFLRASEVMTVFNKRKAGVDVIEHNIASSECFAKLYRRRKNQLNTENDNQQTLLFDRFSSLESLTSPGEWVQVHDGNGELYLEECSNPPTIERNPDGWKYHVRCEATYVYSGPSFQANAIDKLVYEQSFIVSERVAADSEHWYWLRLKKGGWVCSINSNGQEAVEAQHEDDDDRQNISSEQSQRMVRRILEKKM